MLELLNPILFQIVGLVIIMMLLGWLIYKHSLLKYITVGGDRFLSAKSKQVPNNKIIVVANVSAHSLKEILVDFCDLYNQEGVVLTTDLIITTDDRLVVVFPYDISFELFCFAVNYFKYPEESNESPVAIGWASFSASEYVVPQAFNGKDLMVFVPDDDEEHDSVSLVTPENEAYSLSFQFIDSKKNFYKAKELYIEPPFDTTKVDTWAKERIEIVSFK